MSLLPHPSIKRTSPHPRQMWSPPLSLPVTDKQRDDSQALHRERFSADISSLIGPYTGREITQQLIAIIPFLLNFKSTMLNLPSIGVALLSLVATSIAAPSPAPVSEPSTSLELESRASINNCADSTFVNQSSGGSPLVSDCLQIAANIAGGGTWTAPLLFPTQLVQYGTCAFGTQSGFHLGVSNYKVGNADIIDIINDSVNRFQWYGRVGAKGRMPCQVDPIQLNIMVDWGIYHT
ncbi:hypothetical protein CVT24_010962 [Panaeolus cyanescens]|uniref:Ecp2 effector protein-like domain-containing protein n=1 Tax=Panaeolus cyanescens TaxID=181874 RepID=A0A409WDD9_9AGAR|nr:hypothetical protein CVT24_010962 [Panaeolus cyanescens]